MPDPYKIRDFDPPIAMQAITAIENVKNKYNISKDAVLLAYELWVTDTGFIAYRFKQLENAVWSVHWFKPFALPEQQEIDITLT